MARGNTTITRLARSCSGRLAAAVTLSVAALALTGCSMTAASMGSNGSGPGSYGAGSGGRSGVVHGGQQPVTGAHVYLFAAATNGYTAANTSLLNPSASGVQTDAAGAYVLTDSDGAFGISGDYTCPSTPDVPVYLLALGGTPGGPAANPQMAMMAALGSCDALQANAANTFIFVDEVTTVASIYALQGFAQTSGQPGGIGFSTSPTNTAGLANAFAAVPNLASTTLGVTRSTTTGGNGAVPQDKINSLADLLQPCINSTGGHAGDHTACGDLFSATTINSIAPANTLLAVLNIAQNPGNNVTALASLVPSIGAAYQPTLSGPPNDWTIAVNYTGGGISTPQSLAVDAGGDVWVASTNNSVARLSAGTAAFTSGPAGYTSGSLDGPISLAVDTGGAVWIANCGSVCSGSANAASVTQYVPSGPSVTASNFTGGGLNAAYAIAVDGSNNVWVANSLTNTITLLNHAGAPQSGTNGYSAPNLIHPNWIATDAAGLAWSVSPSKNALVVLNDAGAIQPLSYAGVALNTPSAMAIDHSGRAWITNLGSNAVSLIANGTPVGSPFTGAGMQRPNAIALDGSGTAWVANSSNAISALSATGTALSTTGYTASGLTYANGIAVDSSGNVWVSNCGSYCPATGSDTGSVVEFIGAGTPTTTPISTAAATNSLATKP